MSSHATRDWAAEFPILKQMAFFNHAGVAPISARAAAAVMRYADHAQSRAYIGAGWYATAKKIKGLAAQLIGAKGDHEIAFVANTSTGLSQVARGLDWRPGDSVVITGVEFPANRYPWEDLKRRGVELIEVPQQPNGRIDAEDIVEAITSNTRIVALSHVQYASGYRIDLRPISQMVHRAGGYLCVDAIQSVGAMPVNVQELGIDFLSADGHKWMLSPEGCGIFYCREDLIEVLHPGVLGWMNLKQKGDYGDYQFVLHQDARRFEPGSYNIPGVMGLGASLELFHELGMDFVWSRLEENTARLCEGLQRKGYPIFSPREEGERSGIIVFDLPDRLKDAKMKDEPLAAPQASKVHPMMARIVADLEKLNIVIVVREGRLRASPHFYNTTAQIDALVDSLP